MLIRTVLALTAVGCATEHEPDTETLTAYICGDGAFGDDELCVATPPPLVLSTGTQVRTVLAADVNVDGVRDIVAITQTHVFVRYGVLGGGFGAWMSRTTAGADYRDVAVGNFDNDADLDLAVADAGGDRILVFRNDGGIMFPLWQSIATGADPTRVVAARLDNTDARADLAVLADGVNQLLVLRAIGAPFAPPIPYAAGDANDIAIGDCDFDGRRDVMYVNGTGLGTQIHARRVFDNFANLTPPIVSAFPLSAPMFGALQPYVIAAGTFDADNRADLAVTASNSFIAPAHANANCTYAAVPMSQSWAWTRTRLRAFDWDSDGNLDLGAPHGLTGDMNPEVYSVMFGNGAGTFPIREVQSHPSETVIPHDLAMLDGNGDGQLDMLIAGNTGVYLERRVQ
jgi:hypothetical protein